MYTSATINPKEQETVRSSKRIYLDHKTKSSSFNALSVNDTIQTELVNASIHFTCVPLDGKSDSDINKAHELATLVGQSIFENNAIGAVTVTSKVREKDQTIVTTFSFNQESDNAIEVQRREKAIWHPLKMETLKTLLADSELGQFIPVNDQQLTQLGEYMDSIGK